jgi:predicted Zn-dependent protease with MMP-like domain
LAYRVSKAEFDRLVELALAELPAKFAEFLEEVPVEVQNPTPRLQKRRIGRGPFIARLYDGLPLTQR